MDSARNGNLFLHTVHSVCAYVCNTMNEEVIVNNVFDECEIHENCTVEIWKNSQTGEVSIGWWENERKDN